MNAAAPDDERSAATATDPLVLQRERLRLVATMATRVPLATTVVAFLLGAILAREHPLPLVAAWTALMIGLAGLRGWYCLRLLPRLDALTVLDGPARALTVLAFANGLVLGSAILLFGPAGTQEERVLLTTITLVYCAGASATSGAHPPGLLAMVVAGVSQVVVFWLTVGSSEAALLALMLSLTSVMVVVFGLQVSRMVNESVLIRRQNVELLGQLRMERDQARLAHEAAQAANLAKSRFLAATSHDLRQPLHALSMFGSTLTLHVREGPARQLVDQVNNAVKILDRLFVDLLDLSKLDAGAVIPSVADFPLQRLFAMLENEFLPQFEARGLGFSTAHGGLWVRTDPALLERVLRNLVSNALRYTTKGGARLTARVEGESVLVAISDTGIGISAPNVARIFDEYYQVHNPGRRREYGVGLGLAIVRRLVDLLHLTIEVESEPGVGSSFRLLLPRAQSRAEPAGAGEDALLQSPLGLALWLVEDDDLVATAMQTLLAAWGCAMERCTSREDLLALRRRAGAWPDFVVFDDMLGGAESGLDIAQSLEDEIGGDRILMVSGNTDARRLAEISNAGYTLLVKPVDPLALHRRLREASGAESAGAT